MRLAAPREVGPRRAGPRRRAGTDLPHAADEVGVTIKRGSLNHVHRPRSARMLAWRRSGMGWTMDALILGSL